ncbi:hypothetical protein INR49_032677, partial [Caranx melampygus]
MAAPSVHLDLPGDVEKATGPHHVEKATGPHHTEKAHRPHHTKKADRPHHTEVAAGSQTQTSPVPSSPSRVGKDDVEMADGGPQHTEKVDTPHHTEKVDRPHHTEKVDTPHHTEKVDRPHHNEVAAGSQTQTSPVPSSPSRVGKDDVEMADGGPQHTEKVDTPHHTEKVDRPHHTEKVDTPHHTEKVDRPHHNEVAAGSQTQTSPVPSSPSRVGKCKNHRLAFTTVSTLDKCFQCVGPVSSLKWLGYKCKDSIVLSDHEPKENESDSDDCESAEADSTVADQAHANEGF